MSLIITGVIDGPLSGGLPKAVELYVTADIADLSDYGLGSANNGGGTDGQEFTFPAVSATAGSYIYVASEATGLPAFLGIPADHVSGALSINGDDAVELFNNGAVIDLFGDPNADGTGSIWEYKDGWAARKPDSIASAAFNPTDWEFSGPDALVGASDNATAALPFPAQGFAAPVAPAIVINEIDADQTGTDSGEFVELFDGGAGNTALDGLTLVLFNGNGDAAYRSISLDGHSTDADGYFVIGSASVANVDLVAFTTNGLQNGADAVALYAGPAPAAATTDNLLDAIAYDTSDADDTVLMAALGLSVQWNENQNGAKDTEALARVPNGDGGFVAQAPTPGAANEIVAPPTITKIHTVQGDGGTGAGATVGVDDLSPLLGSIVTIEAIVTADFQDGLLGSMGDLNGFYVQEEDADQDANSSTSEGLFVFDGNLPAVDVAVGDKVQITGTVAEFFGETQLAASEVVVMSSGQTLPSSVSVSFPVASTMFDDDGDLVANLEAYEGMLIEIAQDMTITEMFNLDRFGQYNVSVGRTEQFTQNNTPDAAGFAAHQDLTARSTIVLDDGSTVQNPDTIKVIDGNDNILTAGDEFRMGDTIGGINGVLGYSFDAFRIQNGDGTYEPGNPRTDTPEELGGNFTVASLNVLNYFTTLDESGVTTDNGSDPRGADNAAEFDRQATKLVNAITAIDADILGLVEIENDFAGESFAIMDLVERVNAALGDTVYGFVDPGQEFVGGDAIANGLIYKVDAVGLIGDMAILETHNGRNFLDPLDAGRDLNRAAIAQTFEDLDTGQTLTVSVNHLKSKGSLSGLDADEAQGDGQGNNNATRTEAADILAEWLADDPTGAGTEKTLILGDLNAYAKEDPVTRLIDEGYTDLAAEFIGPSAYSFVFDGQIGTLDYAMANDALKADVVGVTEWHVNSDEPDAFDYNLDFGRDPTLFDGATPARNSDHDPVIVAFEFAPVFNQIAGSDGNDRLVGTDGRDWIDAGAGNDRVMAGAGDDVIIGGSGAYNRLSGGDGADLFIFTAETADNGARDRSFLTDFDVTEDMIDLEGVAIAAVRENPRYVRLVLEGDQDAIMLWRVSEFDDIRFVDDTPIG